MNNGKRYSVLFSDKLGEANFADDNTCVECECNNIEDAVRVFNAIPSRHIVIIDNQEFVVLVSRENFKITRNALEICPREV